MTRLTNAQDGLVEALCALAANASEADRNTLEIALNEYATAHVAEWKSNSNPTLKALVGALICEACDRAVARAFDAEG